MKKIVWVLGFSFFLFACSEDQDDNIGNQPNQFRSATFNFSHEWDGESVSSTDFDTIQYTNANGEQMSIELLRYLISDFTFTKENGETIVLEGYNLVDVTNDSGLTFTPSTTIPIGNYSNVSFTFGFDNEDNYNNNYLDLNSASWNVPEMMGGGYHFMQLEGKFINDIIAEEGYAYHAIRAVDMSDPMNLLFQDTFINVDLGPVVVTNNLNFEIEMNIAEWFKSPNQWDLNLLPNMLMPNFDAQVMIYQNGQDVFSLGDVTQ